MDKKKKVMVVLITLTIIFIVIGSTFAYLSWSSSEEQKTQVTFTKEVGYSCSANGGGNITEGDVVIAPTDCTTGKHVIKREITVNPSITDINMPIYMDLWLNINSMGTGLSNSNNFKYSLTTSSTNCETDVVSSGTFTGKTAGDKVTILNGNTYTSTTTETYYLYIWLDKEETSSDTMNQSFSLSLGGSCYNKMPITATTLASKANPSTLMYADATDSQKAEMWTFSHDATAQTGATTDYRYIGNRYCSYESEQYTAPINPNGTCPKHYNYIRTTISDGTITNYYNQGSCPSNTSTYTYECTELTNDGIVGVEPNNYIRFNNEVWRIIGVFDGRIKIIRDAEIGRGYWDYKKSGVGSSTSDYGSNDWTDSQLMYMLNPTSYKLKDGYSSDGTYIYDGNGNIIYQLGCWPKSIASGATSYSCTTNTWSLNSIALSQISEVTYYLGGSSSASGHSAQTYYAFERGTTVYSGRPTNWTGLVGLMYPSDYAYTFANGVDDTCYSDTYNCIRDSGGKPYSSWLYKPNVWTISSHSNNNFVFFIDNYYRLSIIISNSYNNISYDYRPVVYLKYDIKLDGTGTRSDPYVIIE